MRQTSKQPRLTIGIDGRGLLKQRTGVERMLFHFVDNVAAVNSGHRFVLFLDGQPTEEIRQRWPFEVVVEPVRYGKLQKVFDFWLALQLRPLLKQHNVDAFYAAHTKFPIAPVKRFVTVHGLEWHYYASGYKLTERLKQWFWFRACTRSCDGIVTFADHTLADIRGLAPKYSGPICVVPEGVDAKFRRVPPSGVVEALGIQTPFILSVCSLEPRKNIDTLIKAFAQARRAGVQHQLVLVGRSAWKANRLRKIVDDENLGDAVLFAGYVPDEQLVGLYNAADLFVYPSRYEGFGLPVLEAMACGTPVITSDGSALREVAGDAAVLVNPASAGDLADAIRRVTGDRALRQKLVAAGQERVRRYSWEAMARRICSFMTEHTRPNQAATPVRADEQPALEPAGR